MLFNDNKFVNILYEMHNDYFFETEKVLDAGETTKTTIMISLNGANELQLL